MTTHSPREPRCHDCRGIAPVSRCARPIRAGLGPLEAMVEGVEGEVVAYDAATGSCILGFS